MVTQGSIAIDPPEEEIAYYGWVTFNTAATGQLETTVNWTYASNAVFMYLAEGDCTGAKFANDDCPGGPTCECRFVAQSETTTPKPRVLTVSNASPGLRTLVLWNLGPREESLSYQVVLTTGMAGSSPPAQQSVAVEPAGGTLAKRSPGRR